MDDNQVAAHLRTHLAETIGRERYELWFGPQVAFHLQDLVLTVVAACPFTRDWLRRNFQGEIRTCFHTAFGRDVRVEFDVADTPVLAAISPTTPTPCSTEAIATTCLTQSEHAAPLATLPRPKRTWVAESGRPAAKVRSSEPSFASVVIGRSNEYAVRAAEVTAHGVQQASPVLFCGTTGVGKTQLLRTIRAEYHRARPRSRAAYLSAEQFITGFVEALRGSGLPSFRSKCRGADVLLLDDVQFFIGKKASTEELLHTLDVMLAEGRQIVVASSLSLAELRLLGREVVSRLASGLVCEIAVPDFEMRHSMVKRLSAELGLLCDDEICRLVATQISGGGRELRGALHRLQATSQAFGQPLTPPLAESTLADLVHRQTPHVRLADVEHAVCSVFGVDAAQLRSERKSRALNEPRMLAMWLARKYTRAPWSEIGEFFGRRSHSTVISAHRRVENLIRTHAPIGLSHETCGVEEAIRRVEAALRTA